MNIDDKLSQLFNTSPIATEDKVPTIIDNATGAVVEGDGVKIESDYEKTRNNLHELLETGKDALTTALQIAKDSEHPRAFEVVGNLMKQIADINQQLMDIHQQKSKLDNSRGVETAPQNTTTNNAIFVGSTSELSRLIKSLKQ